MNIQLGRGKVHYAGEPDGYKPLPVCGGNRAAEGYRRTSADVNCKNCLIILAKQSAAVADENTGETETMANTEAQDTTAATVEQINANIERALSLAEAENVDGLAELKKETEALISSLPSRGKDASGVSWTQVKKNLRADFTDHATIQVKPQPAPKAEVVVLETRDYHDAEGVEELVALGAQKFTEGVRVHLKTSDLARDIARVLLDMRVRMSNKEGTPDVKATSHGAKTASKDMYDAAGEIFRQGEEVSEFDAKAATLKLIKSVQNAMPTVRAEYLRSLDEDPEEAARFAKILEAAPEGTPASKAVAAHYGVELISRYELDKQRFELEAAGEDNGEKQKEEGDGEGNGEGGGAGATEAEQIVAFFGKAEESIDRAEKALGKAKDDESKEAAKARIDALIAHLATLKAGL